MARGWAAPEYETDRREDKGKPGTEENIVFDDEIKHRVPPGPKPQPAAFAIFAAFSTAWSIEPTM